MNINNAIKSAFENYQAGNLQQAINVCEKIVRIHPDNIKAIHLLGIRQGKLDCVNFKRGEK
jgi:Flp pilus assembly protein TadD